MAPLTLDWLHIVVLLGAAQGVFLAVALASKRTNRTANRLLASAMLAFSLGLSTTVYHAAGLVPVFPHFFGVGYPVLFLYGPLIYLYAIAAADRSHRLTQWDALHFAPFVLTVLWGMPIYMMGGDAKVAFFESLRAGAKPPMLILVADPLKFVSGVSYAVATVLFLRKHSERVKESYSSTERVNLRWLIWLGGSAAGIWLLAVVIQVLDAAGIMSVGRGDDLIALAVSILVYSIGYMGLRQPEIFRFETAEFPVPAAANAAANAARANRSPAAPTPASTGAVPATAQYERSGLTDAEALRLRSALVASMDADQPWRNAELTLADLAERLGTTPHKLSEVLNAQVGETFYDFVNGYRVREVQRRIAAGDAEAKKILSLAMDAGFASKSTFNDVFKKHTGQTPSAFRMAKSA
jgi:AraC-like DNA-binding protein